MNITKKAFSTIGLIILSITIMFALTGCDSEETKAAKESFNNEVERVQASYDALTAEIATAEELVVTEERPLDETLKPALEDTISDAKTVEFKSPSMPSGIDNINAATEELKNTSFDDKTQALKDAETALSNSIEQRKLVTAPSEAFVIERLRGIDGIGEIAALTEETDNNGLLGKAGTYYAKIDFASPWIKDPYSIYSGRSVAENSTDGGGSVEVFETEELAQKRNDYLGAFDGGMFASGSHKVLGTLIVRTSNELTASQQKKLEADIIASLTRLEK